LLKHDALLRQLTAAISMVGYLVNSSVSGLDLKVPKNTGWTSVCRQFVTKK